MGLIALRSSVHGSMGGYVYGTEVHSVGYVGKEGRTLFSIYSLPLPRSLFGSMVFLADPEWECNRESLWDGWKMATAMNARQMLADSKIKCWGSSPRNPSPRKGMMRVDWRWMLYLQFRMIPPTEGGRVEGINAQSPPLGLFRLRSPTATLR